MADSPNNPAAAAKQVVTQLRGLWSKLPKVARLGALGVLALIVGTIAYTTLSAGPEGWVAVTPATMSADDVSELSALLASRNLPQRITPDGKHVVVPASRLTEARMAATTAGLPRNGAGMELFDQTKLGESTTTEKVKYQRATQGELERSIKSLGPIQSARVHLAAGRPSVFRDAEQPPSASVVLTVRPGVTLAPSQVQGVKALVASSITGLTAANVSVIDQHSNVLSAEDPKGDHGGDDAAAKEATLTASVRTLIETIVGPGHVAVVVNVEMDRRKVSESQEVYDPATIALRSSNTIGVAAPTAPPLTGGIAGTQGNLPGAPASTSGGPGVSGVAPGGSQVLNYEVSRKVVQIEQPESKIGRIHVAILVDHQRDAAGSYAALPQATLDEIAKLARQAAGLDEARGDALEIQSFAFAPEEQLAPALPSIEPAPLIGELPFKLPVPLPVAAGGLVGLIALVVVVLSVRRARKRNRVTLPVLALPASLSEIERALDAPADHSPFPRLAAVAVDQRSLEERVLGTVRADVPRAARVLASWLTQPDPIVARVTKP